jgi:phosphoribosylanthranilate isomerase
MGVRVKVCGITTPEAGIAAAEAGADAVGFVFTDSPRRVDPREAVELASHLPPFVTTVAVFRYPTSNDVFEVISRFRPDVLQVEPCVGILDAVRDGFNMLPVFHDGPDVESQVDFFLQSIGRRSAVLLEASGRGGRGVAPDWNRAAIMANRLRLVLAGGLTTDNVGDAIQQVQPYAVDVSSGVESSTGIKDSARIAEFVRSVREAEARSSAEAKS